MHGPHDLRRNLDLDFEYKYGNKNAWILLLTRSFDHRVLGHL